MNRTAREKEDCGLDWGLALDPILAKNLSVSQSSCSYENIEMTITDLKYTGKIPHPQFCF